MNGESQFHSTTLSHTGQRRKVNQDWATTVEISHPNGKYHLLVLADGMGGGMKGEVASRTAVEKVTRYFGTNPWYNPEEASREAAFSANNAVYDLGTGGGQASKSLMGTTLVFALIEGKTGRVWITNVGDSRAYLLRAGMIDQVTRDHSLVAEHTIEGGPLSPREVARLKNVVTRAVGLESTVQPDVIGPIELEAGDRLLLASDGLHGVVSDDRIRRLAGRPLERAATALVAAANAADGPDNITVVIGEWGPPGAPTSGGRLRRKVWFGTSVATAVLAAGALALAVSNPGDDAEPEPTASPELTPSVVSTPTIPSTPATPTASPTTVPTPGTPKAVFEEIAVKPNWTCSGEFERLRRTSGLKDDQGQLLAQPPSVEDAFYKAIDDQSRTSNGCALGKYLVGQSLKIPTCAWLESRTDLRKPNNWKCPQ